MLPLYHGGEAEPQPAVQLQLQAGVQVPAGSQRDMLQISAELRMSQVLQLTVSVLQMATAGLDVILFFL